MTVQAMPETAQGKIEERAPRRDWFRSGTMLVLIVCLLGWIYWPVVVSHYGYNDDYQLLKRVAESSFDLRHNECTDGGRPILALGIRLLFSIPHSIDTLGEARAVSVCGIIVFALAAFAIFRREGFDWAFSATGALLMCLSPGFVVYAGWLSAGFFIWAATLALPAGYLVTLGLEAANGFRRAIYLSCGVLLLLAVYSMYQPVAAFAVIPLLAHAWRGFEMDWKRARTFATGMVLLLLVAAVYFVAFKIAVHAFHLGAPAERASLPDSLMGNAKFVATRLLWAGLVEWFLFSSHTVQVLSAVFVVALILFGCVMRLGKNVAAPFCGLLCIAAAIALTVLPFVALHEQIYAMRILTPLHAVIGIAFLLGAFRMIEAIFPAQSANLRMAACVGLICFAAGMTRFHLYRDFIRGNVREVNSLRQNIAPWSEFPKTLVFIPPARATSPQDDIGEFRDRTVSLPWVAPAMLQLLYTEKFEKDVSLPEGLRRHEEFQVQFGPPIPKGLPSLDGFAALNGPLQTVSDPYWGNIRTNKNGWCCSEWFGVFDNRQFPTIFHEQLGWLNCSGKGVDDFWFWSPRYGWFWTAPKSFPSLMFKERKSWFWLSPNIGFEPSFLDFDRKVWTQSPQEKVSSAPAAKQ